MRKDGYVIGVFTAWELALIMLDAGLSQIQKTLSMVVEGAARFLLNLAMISWSPFEV